MNKKNHDSEAFTKPEIEKVRKGLQIFEDWSVFGEVIESFEKCKLQQR